MNPFRSRWVRLAGWFTPLLLLAGWASFASARVGGGQSYSGGGGGGGGGDGGELVVELLYWIIRGLIELTIDYPAVGIPVDLVVLGLLVAFVTRSFWTASPNRAYSSQEAKVSGSNRVAAGESGLDTLREHDPNFSTVLFQDFAYALYATVQEARGRKDLLTYSPYLSPRALEALERRGGPGLTRVSGVIVAAARLVRVANPDGKRVVVTVEFETNYTETFDTSRATSRYVRERWDFSRDPAVLSRPPETITALHCPKCGGALEKGPDGACRHCGVKVADGTFDWYVVAVDVLSSADQGPLLTRTVAEVGTDLPTVYHPQFEALRTRFLAQDPHFDWDQLLRRVRFIFGQLQQSWSDRTWEKARPYVSDCLFQMLNYWITEYQRQHLRNKLEDVAIESVEAVKVAMDAYYDALTFRIFASMRDYTTDEQGKLVCGNASTPRRFSEYWTFIRRRGASAKYHQEDHCPNCGAPLKINMAGVCEYCRGKVASGDFEWVLSRIEQDEAYQG